MYNFSTELEIASMIAGTKITHLTPDQATYLDKALLQLPKKRLNVIYAQANGEVPSDAYASIHAQNLERTLKDARNLVDISVLTISSQTIDKLIEMANGTAADSYDSMVKKICENRISQFRDPYLCRDTTFHAFRENVGEQCSLALYDCDILLAEEAYTGELSSFRQAITKKFTPRSWDTQQTGYLEAINKIVDIAKADAENDKHYSEVVEKTIVVFQKALSEALIADPLVARKHILFDWLPVYADIKDIGWALNCDWIGLEREIPIACASCRRDLLNLGFRTMSNLKTGNVAEKLYKYHDLRHKVQQTLKRANS